MRATVRATVRDGAVRATTLWRKENKHFQTGRHVKLPQGKRLLPLALQRCKVATWRRAAANQSPSNHPRTKLLEYLSTVVRLLK